MRLDSRLEIHLIGGDVVKTFISDKILTDGDAPEPACSISTELSTDLYTTSERTLVMKKSVKGFQGGDEYVAILYEVEPKDPVIRRYPRIPNNQ
jgi:hypothetical protein